MVYKINYVLSRLVVSETKFMYFYFRKMLILTYKILLLKSKLKNLSMRHFMCSKVLITFWYFLSFTFAQYIPWIWCPYQLNRAWLLLLLGGSLILSSHNSEQEVIWWRPCCPWRGRSICLEECVLSLPAVLEFRNVVAVAYDPAEDAWTSHTISIGPSFLVTALGFSLGGGCHCIARIWTI